MQASEHRMCTCSYSNIVVCIGHNLNNGLKEESLILTFELHILLLQECSASEQVNNERDLVSNLKPIRVAIYHYVCQLITPL